MINSKRSKHPLTRACVVGCIATMLFGLTLVVASGFDQGMVMALTVVLVALTASVCGGVVFVEGQASNMKRLFFAVQRCNVREVESIVLQTHLGVEQLEAIFHAVAKYNTRSASRR